MKTLRQVAQDQGLEEELRQFIAGGGTVVVSPRLRRLTDQYHRSSGPFAPFPGYDARKAYLRGGK